ncbi:hypothetical protein [Granulosicoccus antarcticus]|uniref:Phosphoglycerate mutase n=1 Tax=Granulosicoccus antarcticus IMCC3135 TaxID=1192854 RepID=A0A2Z2NZK0_9GAMM|nr:hypothetical protein [Granulosicoccus antarcticus]ASJ75371.1 hypothetical protein IMCC3135_26580 [Granulosicoccus antarcticus IMCC3135]
MMVSPQINVTVLAPVFPRTSQIGALHWSEGHAMEPWQAQLSRLIAHSDWDAQHLPAAELFRRSHSANECTFVQEFENMLVCADPIHFRADRDSATLIPVDKLNLQASEADALLKSINDFVQADGLRFGRTEAGRWFMGGKEGTALSSYPPSFLAYRNASAFLPEGDASGDWRRLMTELQMLLHTHPVNIEREQNGYLPINSVWFWGGAALQSGQVASSELQQSLRLYADDEYTVALAAYLGVVCEPLDAYSPDSAHPHSLLVDTRLAQALFSDDEPALDAAEGQLVDNWLAPLLSRMKQGDAIELKILNEDGFQGLMNADTITAAASAEHAARVLQMSAAERLRDSLAVTAGKLWNRLAGRS